VRAKSHPEALTATMRCIKKQKAKSKKQKAPRNAMLFLGGSSTWARTRDLRINRKPGSSKILINQWFTREKGKRVIFRVIDQKL